ncbi:hypothetical protein JHD48_03990 [Sulfurimonas sp. SAG-AH-194-I05]|nr:hypothetical protein [Sulfurimonas sp. SAG-AH-194-I05]MDF1874888.1 hypothetical protein [Sulfurimonas sp. SAG-AH-194-I05]
MRNILLIFLLTSALNAKVITPNDVYTLSVLIKEHVEFLLKHYAVKHHHDAIIEKGKIFSTKLKPRNTWQKTYEILVKINMLRNVHSLPRIEPVGIEATLELNPDMVYEMNQRILTELRIFEIRNNIKMPEFTLKKYDNKIPLDNYNMFINISSALDELNKRPLTPNYVYSEVMRIYDDLSIILTTLKIQDNSIPPQRNDAAQPKDVLQIAMKFLEKIAYLQNAVGIESVDFSEFNKKNATPGDAYTVTGLIISEMQTLKAYIGLTQSITPPATTFTNKKPAHVAQLMQWNLQRLYSINKLKRGR